MKADYSKLIETLKRYSESDCFNNLEIYIGEINGMYDTKYSIRNKDVLDTIFSNGDIVPNIYKKEMSYEVSDADFVCISRYKNVKDSSSSKLEKVFLFINREILKEFLYSMVQENVDLYMKVFDKKYYKGNVSKYKFGDRTGFKIVPSKELIELNKKKEEKRKIRK